MRSGVQIGHKINKLWVTADLSTQTLATVNYIQVSKQSWCLEKGIHRVKSRSVLHLTEQFFQIMTHCKNGKSVSTLLNSPSQWCAGHTLPTLTPGSLGWPFQPSQWRGHPGSGTTQHLELQVLSFIRHPFTEHLSARYCLGTLPKMVLTAERSQQRSKTVPPKGVGTGSSSQAGVLGGLSAGGLHECKYVT